MKGGKELMLLSGGQLFQGHLESDTRVPIIECFDNSNPLHGGVRVSAPCSVRSFCSQMAKWAQYQS